MDISKLKELLTNNESDVLEFKHNNENTRNKFMEYIPFWATSYNE